MYKVPTFELLYLLISGLESNDPVVNKASQDFTNIIGFEGLEELKTEFEKYR